VGGDLEGWWMHACEMTTASDTPPSSPCSMHACLHAGCMLALAGPSKADPTADSSAPSGAAAAPPSDLAQPPAPVSATTPRAPGTAPTSDGPAPTALPVPETATLAPLDSREISDEAAKRLMAEEEERRKARRRKKGRIRELEEVSEAA
jgi:hypothetical protein